MRSGLIFILSLLVFTHIFSQDIVAAEYFVDTDLGIGSNTSLSLSSPDSEVILDFILPINSYSEGLHTLYVRVKDNNGKWSIANSALFLKLPGALSPTIEVAEYYFNADPGYGNGIPLSVSGGTVEQTILFQADLMGLSSGLHTLYVRMKDSYGRWSLVSARLVQVVQDLSDDEIIELEYYFTGSGDFISSIYEETVTPASGMIDYSFLATASELTYGDTYTLHVSPRASLSGLGNEVVNEFTFEREIVWTGATSQAWEIGTNWMGGITPSATNNVRVPNVMNDPLITQNHEVKGIQIDDGVVVEMSSDANLSVLGESTGEGDLTAENAATGDFAYSVLGPTVGNQMVTNASPVPNIIYGYSNGNFIVPTTLEPGYGYFMAFNQMNPLLNFNGLPNSGDVTTAISYTDNGIDDDYELVANPYNAPILHSDIVLTNGVDGSGAIDGVIYLWQDGGNNLISGRRDGFYEVVNAEGVSTGLFDGILHKGQGFFVRAINDGITEMSFLSSMQDINPSPASPPGSRKSERSNVKISLSNESSEDALVVCFSEDATIALEPGFDAIKFMNPAVSFYSKAEGMNLAIQTVPSENGVAVSLGYSILESGAYELQIEGIKPLQTVTLIDQLEGWEFRLYNGQVIPIELSELNNDTRFLLVFNNAPLSSATNKVNFRKEGEELLIEHSGLSGAEYVSIYTIEGKLEFAGKINFTNGSARIKSSLESSSPYIISFANQSIKFILD